MISRPFLTRRGGPASYQIHCLRRPYGGELEPHGRLPMLDTMLTTRSNSTGSIAAGLLLLFGLAATPSWAQLNVPRRGAVVISDGLTFAVLVPAEEFRIAEKEVDGCPTRHLHARNGSSVTAFGGMVILDPDPFNCGYGNLKNLKPVQVFVLDIPDADLDGIPDTIDTMPNNPDSDGDGLPDGAEDSDGDGLSDAFELWVSRTDPKVKDSNGNGNDDSVTYVLEKVKYNHVTIPVIINIYDSSTTEKRAKAVVEKANIVLKKARVRLQVMQVNTGVTDGDDGSGDDGTAGDGEFNDKEFRKVVEFGRQELAASPHKRGLKIAFAKAITIKGQATPGVSMRRAPVIAVARGGRSDDVAGSTIAHEFFHTATIDGHPVDGTPEHTDGNAMQPLNQATLNFIDSSDPDKGIENVSLTDSQLELVHKDGIPNLYGKPGTRKSPAVKREYQRGSAVDAQGDLSGASYLDIHTIDIASHTDDEDVHMLLVLGDRFPDAGDVDAVYRLRFDIDDNALTGASFPGINGVDREITIFVERNASTSSLVIGAELSVFDGGGNSLLVPTPELRTVEMIANDGTIPNLAIVDLFELYVPKDLLDLSAATVPGNVASHAGAFSTVEDLVLFEFDRELWLTDPTLSVPVERAVPGTLVPFSLTGLTIGASYDLYLDDTLVFGGTLDGLGSDAAAFTIPSGQPFDFHFLTAVDDAGLLAASALLVVDELIFEDGFEDGDSSQWSATVP